MTTETDLARITYDDLGTGGPALLFLPGWCGDRTVFDPLLPRVTRHRRAISMDLRDHGESARTEADFGTGEVVDDAIAVIERTGVERVVPVGLSHAGWAAIEVRRRLGAERVPAIVLLDWMVLGPPPGFLDALAGLQQPQAWEQVRSALFAMWTTGIDVAPLHDYVAGMAGYGFRHWPAATSPCSRCPTRSPPPSRTSCARCGDRRGRATTADGRRGPPRRRDVRLRVASAARGRRGGHDRGVLRDAR